jgi:bacterioferritin (cytochrome b1)
VTLERYAQGSFCASNSKFTKLIFRKPEKKSLQQIWHEKLFSNVVVFSGAPELQDLYLGQNAMHTVRRGVARDLLLLPHHVGQLAQFSHLSVLELGRFIFFPS